MAQQQPRVVGCVILGLGEGLEIGFGAVAICVGMIPALPSGINLSDHAARSMI
jgi:hypothetical protein